MAISGDGNTLAVGAYQEDSNVAGISGDQTDDSALDAGAVYVFTRNDMGTWSQQAYVKASNPDAGDGFGYRVALSEDGNTLAVGACYEDSSATGINGNQIDDSLSDSGAAYVFTRDGMGTWSQQAYVKSSNSGSDDRFAWRLAMSATGDTLAIGAPYEDGGAIGIGGNQADDSASSAGAVYIFTRDGMGTWSQQAYVKASNTDMGDFFGYSVTLSADGNTLAVGAWFEDSSAVGLDGNQTDDSSGEAGAVYVLTRDGMGTWSHQAYIKASNTNPNDHFGFDVSLSGDGNTLAVGAYDESSNAIGIDGNQANNSSAASGAAYVLTRDGMGVWSQQAYIKPSNTDVGDYFGRSVALSGDGNTLAIGAYDESSDATGIGGNQADNSASLSGAIYVFTHEDGMPAWSQQAYVKAPNTGMGDHFGASLALSGNGNTLAVGAVHEDSNADGISGNQTNDLANNAGAVYLF